MIDVVEKKSRPNETFIYNAAAPVIRVLTAPALRSLIRATLGSRVLFHPLRNP